MQASRRPSTAFTSAQCCFTSAAHALTFTALTKTSLHSSDRPLRFVLRQSLILPPPGYHPGASSPWHPSSKRLLILPTEEVCKALKTPFVSMAAVS